VGHATDADGDGYGAGIDCDDGDPAIHPGAEEHCDGVDEDCDGVVDNDGMDAPSWVEDLDGDGWGGEGTATGCEAPSGHVAEGGDCDDDDPLAFPGAVEHCNDRTDQDCDGEATNGCHGDLALQGRTPDAQLGLAIANIGDHDGDGYDDLAVGAPGRVTDEPVGAAWVMSGGRDRPVVAELSFEDHATMLEGLDGAFGSAVTGLGDLDGDGYDDLAVSAPHAPNDEVVVYVAYGPGPYSDGGDWLGGTIRAGQVDAVHGDALAGLGDLTGDGLPDLAVASPWFDRIDNDDGLVTIYSGPIDGQVSLHAAALMVHGSPERARIGTSLAAGGDHDGDGLSDLLIATDEGGAQAGATVLGGALSGSVSIEDLPQRVCTGSWQDGAMSLAWAGDLDQDGHDDILVGSWGDESTGRVLLFLGPVQDDCVTDATATISGVEAGDGFGTAVLGGFDLDGDEQPDLAAGAPSGMDSLVVNQAGTVSVWLQPPEGAVDASTADITRYGTGSWDNLGASLASIDLDADGVDDLMVGAPSSDLDEGDEGVVWVLFGGEW